MEWVLVILTVAVAWLLVDAYALRREVHKAANSTLEVAKSLNTVSDHALTAVNDLNDAVGGLIKRAEDNEARIRRLEGSRGKPRRQKERSHGN